MSVVKVNNITNETGTAGPVFAGITTISSTGFMTLPVGSTEYRGGRGRGIFAGGIDASVARSNTIDFITISTTGNATDFGDLTTARRNAGSCSSSTRGIISNGTGGSGVDICNIIEYVTISSTGNSFDFGDLLINRRGAYGCSSSTRGLIAGGSDDISIFFTSIEYITIASLGNASYFGDLTVGRNNVGGCASPTRGVFGGGFTPSPAFPAGFINNTDYVTIATTGNAVDYGDLTQGKASVAPAFNSIRGVFGGGQLSPTGTIATNTIDYITIASLGDAIDFGDLTVVRRTNYGCSTPTRGVFGGGYDFPAANRINVIDFVTIMSKGDATDFGDLTNPRAQITAFSDAHGGIGD